MKKQEQIAYLKETVIPRLEKEYYNATGTGQILWLNELVKAEEELKKLTIPNYRVDHQVYSNIVRRDDV